jgi:hypothetical protein
MVVVSTAAEKQSAADALLKSSSEKQRLLIEFQWVIVANNIAAAFSGRKSSTYSR